jgi:thiol-disulfide isomerase/thioredoxin
MNPIVNEVKSEYKRKVNFVSINLSKTSGKAKGREAGVIGTPTFLFYDRDGELNYRLQGVQPRELIERQLDNLIERSE